VAGLLLVASGLLHVGVWAVLGGPWEGPLAWRKPILFGISAGVTLLSLAWVAGVFRPSAWVWAAAWLLAGTLVAEVALITLQTWRGVPSHFNHATPFDAAVADAMTALIAVAVLVLVAWAVGSLGRLRAPADSALAARAGLLLLVLGAALGFVAQGIGEWRLARGLDPYHFGAAGVPKFPHGIPLHALQWLPLLAWLAARAGWTEGARVRAVAVSAMGQILLTVFAATQAFTGRSRADADAAGLALAGLGLALAAGPFVLAGVAWVFRRAVPFRRWWWGELPAPPRSSSPPCLAPAGSGCVPPSADSVRAGPSPPLP
jgi:hypothetical protein